MSVFTFNPNGYSEKEIDGVLRMKANSRRVTFRYDLLDKNDIKIGWLDGITGQISYSEANPIKRTAKFTINEYLQHHIDYLSHEIEPWFILHMPGGGTVEWPLGVFLLESPTRSVKGKMSGREIGAYDKTIILEEDRFTERYYIAEGTNYVGEITKILNEAGITRISIPGTNLTFRADREIMIGEKKRDVINLLLSEINYNSIGADEQGVFFSKPYIEPALRPVTQLYTTRRDSIISRDPEFKVTLELAGRPNVFIRVARNMDDSSEMISTFVNDSPLSPLSTINRGRRIPDYEEIDDIPNQLSLNAFVRRVAIEKSAIYSELSFGTALMPMHGSEDIMFCDFPSVFDGAQKFIETAWEMNLKFDGMMTHEATQVVVI